MKIIDLKSNKIDYDKLIEYGFIKNKNEYIYEKLIIDDKFKVIVNVSKNKITSKIIEVSFNDEYLMADVVNVTGEYVGYIKEEYNNVINDIIKKCTNYEIFEYKQSLDVIKYVKEKYNDDVEYLWEKFPKNAVARNKDNQKWYLAILTVKENRIDGKTDKEIEVLDLLYQKYFINDIVDNKNIFPGYHMNKKSWITVKLDGSFNFERLKELIDNSYNISIGKDK